MKLKIVLLILLLVTCQTIFAQDFIQVRCNICQIDFVEDYFLIYAQDSADNKYLILSKNDTANAPTIEIGQSYTFTFNSFRKECMNEKLPIVITPSGRRMQVDWGRDFYHALELRGLCYNPQFKEEILKKLEKYDNKNQEKSNRKKKKRRKQNVYIEEWGWGIAI